MFRWPNTPSLDSPPHVVADYIELLCWQRSAMSDTAVTRHFERLEENDHTAGVQEDSDIEEGVDCGFREIEARIRACGPGYPFSLDDGGHNLRRQRCAGNSRRLVYLYLLLATRLNMTTARRQDDIDGTQLFEKLSAMTAEAYFGQRTESFVFGTAAAGTFREKITELCSRIGEGEGFRKQDDKPAERDGGLDVVVWKHFEDRTPGKLIGFGQCKTGTSYPDNLSPIDPGGFCNKWMIDMPIVTPTPMYFVAEAQPRHESKSRWRKLVLDVGLLFDRCRIVDYCNDLRDDLLCTLGTWTSAAAIANDLPIEDFLLPADSSGG